MSDLKERIMAKMGLKSIPVPSAQPAPPAPASGPPAGKPKKKRRVPSRQITRQQAKELGLRPLLEILSAEEVAKYLPTAEAAGALGRAVVAAYQSLRGKKPPTCWLKHQAPFNPQPVTALLCLYAAEDIEIIQAVMREEGQASSSS